jgi:hypothetical protein
MMRRTWLNQLVRGFSPLRSPRRAGRRPSARPQLEGLEGRCLPSVNVFLSGRVLHAEGDNNGNFVELDHGGSTTLLASVPVNDSFFDSIVINPGNGNNAVLVTGTVKATTINTGRNSDRIDIGEPVDLLVMRAPIAVNGQGSGIKNLNYNDQANPTAALTYTLSATTTGAGRVQRNGLADLTYGGITNLTVNTGTVGSHTVNVLSTAFPTSTTVNGGRGDNTFIVGDFANRLQTLGLLTVNGGSGHNLLSFRDMGTTLPATYAITPTFVNRPLGGAIATGSAGNTFRMGAGPFNGTLTLTGGGPDKLDYSQSNGDVYVNLQTGEATNLTAFSGIRDVTGSRGNSILVGDGHGHTLTGGPGPGRNLLIAGGSDFTGQGDTLQGGNDEDSLIAGFTDYDTDRDSLMAIMAAWTGPGFYADRVAALTTGAGVPLLDATTVHSNGGNNVLLGNAGFDLFFANPDRDQTDADPEAEVVVQIF